MFLYHADYVCFLLWRNTTADNCFACLANLDKAELKFRALSDANECICLNYQSTLDFHLHELLIFLNELRFAELLNLFWCSKFIDFEALLDKLARLGNVLSCIELIARQHPDFNASFL